jgi:hypothetical protein
LLSGVRTAAVLAIALLIVLAGAVALGGLWPVPGSAPLPLVTATASTSAGATSTAQPTVAATTAPSPTFVPSPAPVDFVLPPGCAYVGEPTQTAVTTDWRFDCGVAANREAVQTLSPAFAQQGWILCKSGQGRGVWWNGATETIVAQAANDYPVLSQLPRDTTDCP